jgi:uncharacterized protein (TIGR03435 family)
MNRAPRYASLHGCLALFFTFGIAAASSGQSAPAGVQIALSRMAPGSTSLESGADRWSARGFDLKTLIAQVWDVDARRVDLSDAAGASARYDVTLALPEEQSWDVTQRLLEEAIEKKFRLTIAPESRLMNVYVLTAPNGPGPALHPHGASAGLTAGNSLMKLASFDGSESATDDAQQITYVGKDCSGVAASGIAGTAASIAEFRRTLEPDLDRVLVDETKLGGSYDFRIGNYSNQQELFQLLRDQLGLVVAAQQREVVVLAARAE